MTQPTTLPVADTTAATPAFRRVLAVATGIAAFWLVARLVPANAFIDIVGAGVGLAVGVLAYRNATFLLGAFVVLMPVGLFVAGIAGL